MNRFFTLLFAAFCFTAVGQVTYPYNPDGNADSLIGASDIQDLLSGYGLPFLPGQILVDSVGLEQYLDSLKSRVELLESQLMVFEGMIGCGIPFACNYNPSATIQTFESCELPEAGHDCDGNFVGLQIGDFYLGGVVFQVWDDGMHGRVISPHDLGSAPWGCMNIDLNNPTGYGYGPSNTADILNECESPNAAEIAVSIGDGWYLPPMAELEKALEVLSDIPDGSVNFWYNTIESNSWGYNSGSMILQYQESIGWDSFGQQLCWSSSDVASCCAWCARTDWYTNQFKTGNFIIRAVREF